MHAAAPGALWAACDECTCAGVALLAILSMKLQASQPRHDQRIAHVLSLYYRGSVVHDMPPCRIDRALVMIVLPVAGVAGLPTNHCEHLYVLQPS